MTEEEMLKRSKEIKDLTYSRSRKYTTHSVEFVMVDRDTTFKHLTGRVLWIVDQLYGTEIKIGCDSKWELVKLAWWIIRAAMKP